jgi:hypothetical protein
MASGIGRGSVVENADALQLVVVGVAAADDGHVVAGGPQ